MMMMTRVLPCRSGGAGVPRPRLRLGRHQVEGQARGLEVTRQRGGRVFAADQRVGQRSGACAHQVEGIERRQGRAGLAQRDARGGCHDAHGVAHEARSAEDGEDGGEVAPEPQPLRSSAVIAVVTPSARLTPQGSRWTRSQPAERCAGTVGDARGHPIVQLHVAHAARRRAIDSSSRSNSSSMRFLAGSQRSGNASTRPVLYTTRSCAFTSA